MNKIHLPTSNTFYDFLDKLPDKRIFFDTNTLHPGTRIIKPDFKECEPDEITQRLRKTNATATTFQQLGYTTTQGVYWEITHITEAIRRNRQKAEKMSETTMYEEECCRLMEIEYAYSRALELAEEQQEIIKETIHPTQVNSKFRDLLTKVVYVFSLDRKTIKDEGKKIELPASSKTDIDLVISTFSQAETEPTGVLSLDKDIPTIFALCTLILYDKRSPFRRDLVRTKPQEISAHFFYQGTPHHCDARNITDIIDAIPREKEDGFFDYLKRKHEELYTRSTKSGRFKITTAEDVTLAS